ncbi:leukocidin family pore-forming toxin [Aeromonas hydrophila]|uniref:leukocidin family pore-forming toxin n=1 Tax=Aeromonas hydrophila TaxID=644 RepID=UPI001FC84384|nr:leukocidin family pore-forming toxin [Aeromonas hydrophila]GKQ98981.1 hemolysin ahh1 [Aeromonas hydrophila]
MKKTKLAILLTTLASLSTPAFSLENTSPFVTKSNFDTDDLNYFNLNHELVEIRQKNDTPIPSHNYIKQKVLENGEIFLFDFSDIKNASDIEVAKEKFRKIIPLSFDENALLISRHNGKLMLSPINTDKSDKFLDTLQRAEQLSDQSDAPLVMESRLQGEFNQQVPMIEYYLNLNNTNITQNSTCGVDWDGSTISTCSSREIDLIFLVSLASSEKSGMSNGGRFVRVSIGKETQGRGITLNHDAIKTIKNKEKYSETAFMSAPLIEEATFSVKSDKNSPSKAKARIFKSFPENINPEQTVSEGNEISYNTTLSLTAKQPTLTTNITSKQSRNVTVTSKEYAISKRLLNDPTGGDEAIFSWERKLFNTAKENMKWYGTQNSLNTKDPLIYDNISRMSYENLMPSFDVTFVNEEKGKVGTGLFNIEATITPKVFKAYGDVVCTSTPICRTKFRGDSVQTAKLKAAVSFKVDWDNPVFIGQWPVNLQLGGVSSKCTTIIGSDSAPRFSFETCDIKDNMKQGFFMDKFGRLQSVSAIGYCLERISSDINKKGVSMGLCNDNMKLEQHWVWEGDNLINQLYKEQVFVNIDSNEIILANDKPQESNPIAYSRFLELFTPM